MRDALGRARGGSIARCDGARARRDADEGELPHRRLRSRAGPGRCASPARSTASGSCASRPRRAVRRASRWSATAARRVRSSSRSRDASSAPGQVRFSITLTHPLNPGAPADARERNAQPPLAAATYHAGVSEQAGIRAHRGRPGRAVRLVPLLQDRPCLAPPADRGARGRQGRVRRGGRGLGRPHGGPAGLQRLGHPARGRLLPLADHGALRRPARARRRPQRHAARRLADDAVLLPRDDEAVGLHRQEARPPGQGDPP